MYIDPKKSSKRARLYFLNYDLRDFGNGMMIYSRKKQRASSEDKKPEDTEPDLEKGDGDLMQAMFDESAAMAEAFIEDGLDRAQADESSSLADLGDLQEEYEQYTQIDDTEYIEDMFSANEIGEELCKLAIEKEKEANKQESLEKMDTAKKGPSPPKKESVKDGQDEAEQKPPEPSEEFLW